MEILDPGLLKLLPQLKQGQNVTLKLPQDISPKMLGQVQRVMVLSQLADSDVLLQLADGQQLKATLEPPLPVGTRITLLAKSPTETMIRQILPPLTEKPATPMLQQPSVPTTTAGQVRTLAFPPQQPLQLPLSLPPQAPALPVNTLFSATVLTPPTAEGAQTFQLTLPQPTNTPSATTPTLPTPQPTVTAQATPPAPLPVQTTLSILQPPQGQPQVVSLTLPQPGQTPNTQTVSVPTQPLPTATPAATPAQVLPTPAQVQVNLPAPTPQQPALQPQQEITLTLAKPVPQPAAATPQPGTPAPVTQTATLPNGSQAVVTLPQAVPEGTQMTVRIGADGLPQVLRITADLSHQQGSLTQHGQSQQGQTGQAPILTPGGTFRGLITAQAPHNQMILTLNTGHTVQVHADHPLPTGTQVTITVQADGAAQIQDLTLPTGSARADAAYRFSKEWPLLKQAIATLRNHDPAMAERATATLPRPDTLLPTLTQFADALKHKASERLLGDDTANLLRALGVDLTPDMQALHQLHQRPDTQDGWRAMLFPYVENQQDDPQQGGFFWRRQKGEEEQTDSSLRFILQLRLSQFGPMQLDGLMNEKTMTLKLHLQEEPGQTFRQELTELVNNSLTAYGLQGQLQIFVSQNFPTDPLAEIQHHAGHMDLEA